MIGASLEQLDSLKVALGGTAGDIAQVGIDSARVAAIAVDEMETAAEQARSLIETAMETMIGAVHNSKRELAAQDWTGPNRATFDGHYETFSTAMQTAQNNTNQTFLNLKSAISSINIEITTYAGEILTSMETASESANAMSDAVRAQRENLEAAMGGMSVG
ncbi:MAG: hypothetical protein HKN03_06395 [Acidimicrobiales bacterium]|nr:hypothetical protein [Acidimicrobiales bacterium]